MGEPEIDVEKLQKHLRRNEEARDRIISTAEADGGLYTLDDVECLRQINPYIARARTLLGLEPAADSKSQEIRTLEDIED